jgi:epoxyqueuosine reductase
MMTPLSLAAALKEEAARLGFDLAGATPAASPPGIDRFEQWLAEGHAGRMGYLADRVEAYRHPRHVLEGARSILMLGTNYRTAEPVSAKPGEGNVSRYAWGIDYHELIRRRLRRLGDFHRRLVPEARCRGVVDTAPLAERQFAQLAGLGWIGKNTLLLSKRFGSWLFLAALLTTEELAYDEPFGRGHCGSCRACLDACPTGALVGAHRLDARRCISYLTIELRERGTHAAVGGYVRTPYPPPRWVPPEFREAIGERLFGCDACQEACPWNRRTPIAAEEVLGPKPGMNPVSLVELFALDEGEFQSRFRHTPLWRCRRRGILRNAAVVLGNRPHPAALPALMQGLEDPEPLIRAASAWALGRYADSAAQKALQEQLTRESDAKVRGEIAAALQRGQPAGGPSPGAAGASGD